MALRFARCSVLSLKNMSYMRCMSTSGMPGSGVGHGGGAGGSVRDSGGAFGKREAAFEDEYFYKLNKAQLEAFQNSLFDQISYHKDEIADHQKAMDRHQRKIDELKGLENTVEKKKHPK